MIYYSFTGFTHWIAVILEHNLQWVLLVISTAVLTYHMNHARKNHTINLDIMGAQTKHNQISQGIFVDIGSVILQCFIYTCICIMAHNCHPD